MQYHRRIITSAKSITFFINLGNSYVADPINDFECYDNECCNTSIACCNDECCIFCLLRHKSLLLTHHVLVSFCP